MFTFGILLVWCASVAAETCNESPPSCSLFPNQDRGVVSLQDITQKVQSKHWIMIYYSGFTTKQSYGKCNFRWNAPGTNQNIAREAVCYNMDKKACEDFTLTVKHKTSDCNRAEENNGTAMNDPFNGKFYSQDLDTYIWFDVCYENDNRSACTSRYIDLLVRKTKNPDSGDSELDLQGLPWQLIASDLKYHFGMDMSDNRMKFSWKGPDCGFDGDIIETSSGCLTRVNIVDLIIFIASFSLLLYI